MNHERYQIVKIINCSKNSQTLKAIERYSNPPLYYWVKQFDRSQYSSQDRESFNNIFSDLLDNLSELSNYSSIPKTINSFREGEYFYIVREWIEGFDLKNIIDRENFLTVDRVWLLLENILPVLKFIHDRCLVHRNIKPSNIIYDPNTQKYVLVGWTSLGKLLDSNSNSIYSDLGSPEYTAPEQLKGQAIVASDLYSLGVTCVYLLTGISPFDAIDSLNNCWIWRDYWLEHKYREHSSDRGRIERLANIIDKLIAPISSESPSEINSDRYICADTVLRNMGIHTSQLSTTFVPTQPQFTWKCEKIIESDRGLFGKLNIVALSECKGIVANISDDRNIRLWKLATGEEIATLNNSDCPVTQPTDRKITSLAFIPQSSQMVSGNSDGTIQFWDLDRLESVCTIKAHKKSITSIAFNNSGEIFATASTDRTVELWNTERKELIATLQGHRLGVNEVTIFSNFFQNGIISDREILLASASQDRTVIIWDVNNRKPRFTLIGHTWAVQAIAFSPIPPSPSSPLFKGILASGGDDNTIKIWDVSSGNCLRTFSGHSWTISALAFLPSDRNNANSPDSWLLSASWDKTVKLWQVSTGEQLTVLQGHTDSIDSLAVSAIEPDKTWCLVTSSKDGTLRVWRLKRD
jgi:WD40 repeat protein